MESGFESYCRKCGRPIFAGDLFEYNPKSSIKALCIVCHTGNLQEYPCPHWAIWQINSSFTPSNRCRYNPYTKRDIYGCLICKQELYALPQNTTYVQADTTARHGMGPGRLVTGSYIVSKQMNPINDPDTKSLQVLNGLLQTEDYSEEIIQIIRQHIKRIEEHKCERGF